MKAPCFCVYGWLNHWFSGRYHIAINLLPPLFTLLTPLLSRWALEFHLPFLKPIPAFCLCAKLGKWKRMLITSITVTENRCHKLYSSILNIVNKCTMWDRISDSCPICSGKLAANPFLLIQQSYLGCQFMDYGVLWFKMTAFHLYCSSSQNHRQQLISWWTEMTP